MIGANISHRTGRLETLFIRGLLAALFVVPLAVGPLEGAALAQAPSTEIEAAKKVAAETANSALLAFESGKYEDAITGFQKAEKAFHAPKFLLYVGRSQVKLGRLLAAKDTYEGIVREKLASYAPAEFFSAQATARKELAELTNRIPSIQIQAKSSIQSVTLDGKVVSPGQAVPVDPGEHTITGTAPGRPEVRRKITVAEGEARTETLEPPPVSTPAAPATSGVAGPAADPTSAPGAASTPGRGVPTVTYVAYGTGAAGLVLGAIFGGLTLVKKGEFDRSPTAEAADQGETFSHVADAGFALALVGAAVGTIVWVVSPRDSGPSPPRGSRAAPPGLFVAPRAAGLTIGGTF